MAQKKERVCKSTGELKRAPCFFQGFFYLCKDPEDGLAVILEVLEVGPQVVLEVILAVLDDVSDSPIQTFRNVTEGPLKDF